MARAADQFRRTDMVGWGGVFLLAGAFALGAQHLPAFLPPAALSALHNSRAVNAQAAELVARMAELDRSSQGVSRIETAEQQLQADSANLAADQRKLQANSADLAATQQKLSAANADLQRLQTVFGQRQQQDETTIASLSAANAALRNEVGSLTQAKTIFDSRLDDLDKRLARTIAMTPPPAGSPLITGSVSSHPAVGGTDEPMPSAPAASGDGPSAAFTAPADAAAPATTLADTTVTAGAAVPVSTATPPLPLPRPNPAIFARPTQLASTTPDKPIATPNVRAIGVAIGNPVQAGNAMSTWQDVASRIGVLLVGTSPLLADDPAGGAGKVLIAGPVADIRAATALCGKISEAGLNCTPMPYVGAPITSTGSRPKPLDVSGGG